MNDIATLIDNETESKADEVKSLLELAETCNIERNENLFWKITTVVYTPPMLGFSEMISNIMAITKKEEEGANNNE